MKVWVRALFITLMCVFIYVPDSCGAKKTEHKTLEPNEVIQQDLSYVQQDIVELSQETIIDFQEEVCNILLLLDYGFKLFNSAKSSQPVKSLFEDFKLDSASSSSLFFVDAEECLRDLVFTLVGKLKLSEKVFYKKPEAMESLKDFCFWMSGYTPFIVFFLDFCLKKVSGTLFQGMPGVFEVNSPDYIDVNFIIQLLSKRILQYCGGSAFRQTGNNLLAKIVSDKELQACGQRLIQQIIERHKKVCVPDEIEELENFDKLESIKPVLHRIKKVDFDDEKSGDGSGDEPSGGNDSGVVRKSSFCGLPSYCGLSFKPYID